MRLKNRKLNRQSLDEPAESTPPNVDSLPPSVAQLPTGPLITDTFSDLDRILSAARTTKEPDPAVTVEPNNTRTSQQVSPAVLGRFGWQTHASREARRQRAVATSTQPSNLRLTTGFIAAVLSAALAFWFGILICWTRFAPLDHILLKPLNESLTEIFTGRWGLPTMTSHLSWSMLTIGWLLCVVGLAMLLFAVGQFFSALVQLFIQQQWLTRIDAAMASASIAMVFLLVATMFVHANHTANLRRELNHSDPTGVVNGEASYENVKRLRAEVNRDADRFLISVISAAAIPLMVFGCSITRMILMPANDAKLDSTFTQRGKRNLAP